MKTIEDAEYLSEEIINEKISKIESKLSLIERLVASAQKNITEMKDEFKKIK